MKQIFVPLFLCLVLTTPAAGQSRSDCAQLAIIFGEMLPGVTPMYDALGGVEEAIPTVKNMMTGNNIGAFQRFETRLRELRQSIGAYIQAGREMRNQFEACS